MISASMFRTSGKTAVVPGEAPKSEPSPAASEIAAVAAAPGPEAAPASDGPNAEKTPAEPVPAPPTARSTGISGLPLSRMKARLSVPLSQVEKWGKPAAAATLALAIGALGYTGGLTAPRGADKNDLSALRWSEAASTIRDSREETARMASEVKFMRIAVDGLKNERARGDLAGKQAQVTERLERLNAEMTDKLAKLSEQLERVEKAQRDPARVTALMERLDKIERGMQTASGPAPTPPPKPVAAAPAAPADVNQTGSIAEPRHPAKPAEIDHRKVQIEGFVLRDIDDGLALIEAKNGRFFEVSPGMNLPGIGKVEAIEKRGRQWVVVTPKGFIGER